MSPETQARIRVSPEGQLELPAEVMAQLHPGDEYQVSVNAGTIVLKKVEVLTADVDEIFRRMRTMEPDPNQPTLAEISEWMKEGRHEQQAQHQS